MKKLALALLMSMSTAMAQAGEVYGNIGTEGVGVGYAYPINGSFNVRGELNALTADFSRKSAGVKYKGDLKLGGVSLLVDYFPFASRFRVSGGLVSSNGRFTGTAHPNSGAITLNGTTYAYSGADSIKTDTKFGTVSPYLGVGSGHVSQVKGWAFFSDFGIIFQKPESTLVVSPGLARRISAADREAAFRARQDVVDSLKFYPVVKVGVSYGF